MKVKIETKIESSLRFLYPSSFLLSYCLQSNCQTHDQKECRQFLIKLLKIISCYKWQPPFVFLGLPTVQFMITCSIQKRMQKNRGGRPGLFYHVNDVFVYLGRQREGRGPQSNERILHTHSSFWTRSNTFSLRKHSKLQHFGQKLQDQASSSFFGPLPSSVYLYQQTKCHSHDKMDQAFHLRFCTLQAIKNWTVGRSGNEAI